MKKFLFIFSLLAFTASAQPKKYQSLLWEISGNGLAKKSYLYGSMHVSDKISYHLSDAFFKHLLASDYVATESDPSTWMAIYDVLSPNQSVSQNLPFYAQFYQKPAKREDLYSLFVNDNNVINNLLSRTNETQKDFQEDTYLDMFIYQTGRKYKKKVIGLENARSSLISVMNAENTDAEPKKENVQALVKVLRERSLNQAMLDFYREKNLDMLDSLYVLMTPSGYHKALITDRNSVMLKSIDSIAKKGSLFAAVGAAHLPGKKGLIEMLREKGYTVKPVVDAYTATGLKTKKTIDGFFVKPQFEIMRTSDGMITAPMLTHPIYSGNDIGTPDLANGAMVNLKRVPLHNYLSKDAGFNPATLDSLFYENIPGNILNKRTFTEDNATVFDITSQTKIGNAQRYRYYITPLEVICVSMNGNGAYVRRYENEVFPNIRLKKYTSDWETVSPGKGGFSIALPSYNILNGNRTSVEPENVDIQAYDASDKSYYFVSERTINDNQTLEETAFELKRIQQEFFTQLNAKLTPGSERSFDNSYESHASTDNRRYALKTIVQGQKYYLLGAIDATSENATKFFQSFTFRPFRSEGTLEKFEDSIGHFAIKLPRTENERLFWKVKDQNNLYGSDRKNVFQTIDKQYALASTSGKTADLFAWTYHRYDYVHNLDTLKASIRRNILQDYNPSQESEDASPVSPASENIQLFSVSNQMPASTWERHLKAAATKANAKRTAVISNWKEQYDESRKLLRIDLTVNRPGSNQAIAYIAHFQDGYIWYLRSLVDKNVTKDPFLETLADSFAPFSDPPANSLFKKKIQVFIEDAKSENDSIRYSAFASSELLHVDRQDIPALREFVSSFEFRADESAALASLMERLGKLDAPEVIPFLDYCYKKEGANAMLQLAIIRALAKQKTRQSYQKISQLLEYDLPLSDDDSEIETLFALFAEDTQNSQILYPAIFQYYGVSEYHDPIVSFVTQLIRENKANPKKIKPYRKMLLADARLEAKRLQVWKAKKAAAEDDDYNYNYPSQNLRNYAILLYGLQKDSAIKEWFVKLDKLDMREIDHEIAVLELSNNKKIDDVRLSRLLQDPTTSFSTYRLLQDAKQELPQWPDTQIAEALVRSASISDTTSKTELLAQREVTIYDRNATVFFFRTTTTSTEPSYGITTKLQAVAFLTDNGKIDSRAWSWLPATTITDNSEIEEAMNVAIDRLLKADHKRATFGKIKNNQYDPEYEF